MKVSVIVPMYNVEKYLCRCLDSLLSQTYEELEILLIDDGSPDASGKTADEYAKNDARIKVIHKKNGGLSDARNCGIENCTGEYLYIIDSDDYIERDAIQNMVNAAVSNECTLVMSGYFLDYANEGYSVDFEIPNEEVFRGKKSLGEAIFAMENLNFNVVWNKLYSADIIKSNNLRFAVDGMPGEDLLFNCAYMMCEPSVALIKAKTYHYMRQDEDSLAGKYRSNLYSQVLRFIKARKEMYAYYGMNEEKYREVYARTFVGYIFSCIPNLYKQQCKISRKEKKAELKMILNTPELAENLKMLKNKTGYQKLVGLLYKLRRTCFATLVTDMLFCVRYKMEPTYKKIRKKINKG